MDENDHTKYAYSKATPSFTSSAKEAYSLDEVHLENAYWVSCADIQDMKYMITEYGAGTIGYYHSDYYVNNSTGAYCYMGSQYANHEVTVVGWDDNYSRTNFNTRSRPDNNGAWLVKNSWGEEWGNDGYFWMSYEDTSLCRENASFYEFASADNYDNNYQHDGSSLFDYEEVGSGAMMANVFTADSNETLEAISFWTAQNDVDYKIQIYTNVSSKTNPTSGQPALPSEMVGNEAYAGYHTIELPSSILLPKDTTYSVVVTLSCNSEAITDLMIDKTDSSWGWIIFKNTAEEGQSFYKTSNGTVWTDKSASGINYRIKSFTNETEDQGDISDITTDTIIDTTDIATELGALESFDPVFDMSSLETGDRIAIIDDYRSVAAVPQLLGGSEEAVMAKNNVYSARELSSNDLWTVIKIGNTVYLADPSGKQLIVTNDQGVRFGSIGTQLTFSSGYHIGGYVISALSNGVTSYLSYDEGIDGFSFFTNYSMSSEYTVEFSVYKANFAQSIPSERETVGEYSAVLDPSTLEDGDRVILYNNAYMQALMPQTLSDKSTVLAVAHNLKSGDDFTAEQLWTVVKDGDSIYLANDNGMMLAASNSNTVSLNSTGSAISFEEGSVEGTFRITTDDHLTTKRFLRFNESIYGYRFYTAADISSNFAIYKYTEQTVERREILLGDVNDDGEITMFDVVETQRLIGSLIEETSVRRAAADINSDGDMNMSDVVFMQRVLAGLEGSYQYAKTVITL